MIIEALLLGLSTGAYCLFSCAPVVTPLFLSVEPNRKKSFKMVSFFLSGRLAGYLVFGVAIGLAGVSINRNLNPEHNIFIGSIISIVTGLLLVLAGLNFQFPKLPVCRILSRYITPGRNSFVFGLFTGVNVCPPFLGAASRVMDKGGVIYGLVFFLIFFIATSIYFMPYLGVSFITKRIKPLKEIARFSMLIIGFYILVFRGFINLLKVIL